MNTNTKGKKRKKILRWLLLVAAASLVCFISLKFLWVRGDFLPGWIDWVEKQEDYSFTVVPDSRLNVRSRAAANTLPPLSEEEKEDPVTETVRLKLENKKFMLGKTDGTLLFETDSEWLVSDYLIGDIDHDDEDEIVLLVWKIGSFGHYKPIWVKENEDEWSQHIFIYDYDVNIEGRMNPLWMSSEMGIEAKSIYLDEEEKLHIRLPDDRESVWNWENWGLILLK